MFLAHLGFRATGTEASAQQVCTLMAGELGPAETAAFALVAR